MYFHEDARMIFLCHPRTASNATSEALKRIGFICPQAHHDRLDFGLGVMRERYGVEVVREDWTVACTVRHHLDALVSWWHWHGRQQPLDRAFVEHVRERARDQFFPRFREWWGLHSHDADTVLLYEKLDADLNRWLASRGLGPVTLERLNRAQMRPQGVHYKFWIDTQTAEYVGRIFGPEIRRLGYPDPVEATR
jgi:hypothetical protein